MSRQYYCDCRNLADTTHPAYGHMIPIEPGKHEKKWDIQEDKLPRALRRAIRARARYNASGVKCLPKGLPVGITILTPGAKITWKIVK